MKFKIGTHELEIGDDVITAAITNKTASLDFTTDLIVRTSEEDNRFVENMKKAARIEGVEISVKKTREALGLTFEGKTIEGLVTAVSDKAKADSGIAETEKVKKLEVKLQEKTVALTSALSRVTEVETSSKALKSGYKIDRMLDLYIPKDTVLPTEDVKTIMKAKLRFAENESGVIEAFDIDGNQVVNSQTRDALPAKEVVENFFRDNVHYMKVVDGGGGGGDSTKGGKDGKMSIEQFNEDMKTKGHAINSEGYDAELNKAIAAKTLDID
jgi:hypothetical protein